MSLTEIKDAVETLSPRELAELASFIREREDAPWDRQIDEDFAENGRLRPVLEEIRKNIQWRRLGQCVTGMAERRFWKAVEKLPRLRENRRAIRLWKRDPVNRRCLA